MNPHQPPPPSITHPHHHENPPPPQIANTKKPTPPTTKSITTHKPTSATTTINHPSSPPWKPSTTMNNKYRETHPTHDQIRLANPWTANHHTHVDLATRTTTTLDYANLTIKNTQKNTTTTVREGLKDWRRSSGWSSQKSSSHLRWSMLLPTTAPKEWRRRERVREWKRELRKKRWPSQQRRQKGEGERESE